MEDKVYKFFQKLPGVLEKITKYSDKFAMVVALVVVQFILVSAFALAEDATATPQILFDSQGTWKEANDIPYGVTGDKNVNYEKLGWYNLGRLEIPATLLFGVESFSGGTERAEEVGLSSVSRYGMIAMVDNQVMGLLYNQPGVNLVAHFERQWVPGAKDSPTTVYAQGEGYTFLKNQGLEPVWEVFRNLSYAGFVIIVVVAGFMIMFRSKIGGQVTVNIMNTIPNVLIGLLVVTLSFAIVGFILDLGRLATLLIASYLGRALNSSTFQIATLGDPFQMARDAFIAVNPLPTKTPEAAFGVWGGMVAGGVLGILLSGITGGISAAVGVPLLVAGIVPLLIACIIGFFALYGAIRVFVTLVMSYIKIVIDLVLGPVYILLASLPGRENSMVEWLKRIVSNVLVFPIVFIILNLTRYVGLSVNTQVMTPIEFLSGSPYSPSGIPLGGVLIIAGYFIAAGAPSIISDLIPMAGGRGMAEAMGGAQKAASKLPVVGGLLG